MNPDETRAKILAATDHLFGVLGFDATTTREIASHSGVNKALIHYHFRSKDELFTVLLDGYYARLTTAMAAALSRHTDPEAQVREVIDVYATFLAENRTFCTIVQREVANGHHVERIVAGTLPMFQLGTGWLKQLLPHPPPEPELVHLLTSIYGMVVTYFTHGRVLQQLNGEDPFSPEALAARRRHIHDVIAILFRHYRGEPPPRRRGKRWPPSTRRTPRKKTAS